MSHLLFLPEERIHKKTFFQEEKLSWLAVRRYMPSQSHLTGSTWIGNKIKTIPWSFDEKLPGQNIRNHPLTNSEGLPIPSCWSKDVHKCWVLRTPKNVHRAFSVAAQLSYLSFQWLAQQWINTNSVNHWHWWTRKRITVVKLKSRAVFVKVLSLHSLY